MGSGGEKSKVLFKLPFLLGSVGSVSVVSPVKGGSWALVWWCGVSMWGWFHFGLSLWEPSTGTQCRLVAFHVF